MLPLSGTCWGHFASAFRCVGVWGRAPPFLGLQQGRGEDPFPMPCALPRLPAFERTPSPPQSPRGCRRDPARSLGGVHGWQLRGYDELRGPHCLPKASNGIAAREVASPITCSGATSSSASCFQLRKLGGGLQLLSAVRPSSVPARLLAGDVSRTKTQGRLDANASQHTSIVTAPSLITSQVSAHCVGVIYIYIYIYR